MELKRNFVRCFFAAALTAAVIPAWSATQPAAANVKTESAKVINVNTADAATLAAGLKGIGNSKAEAIIAYRKEHGPFKSADQLAEVKGIGDKWIAANKDRITVK